MYNTDDVWLSLGKEKELEELKQRTRHIYL